MTIDTEKYKEFVFGVMSDYTKDQETFETKVRELTEQGLNIPMILTASLGLSGETGEVNDIIKKVIFHGKPFTDELRLKLREEIGDIFWYIAALCIALDFNMDEIMDENVTKLQTRYPGGVFSIERSENRIV